MGKPIIETADLEKLADEVITIIAEREFNSNMERVEMLYEVGRAVIDKPYYKKHTIKAGFIIKELSGMVGRSERWVYLAVKFAESYPSFATVAKSLDPGRKGLTVRNIALALAPPSKGCEHSQTVEEEWIVKKCRGCGYIISRARLNLKS